MALACLSSSIYVLRRDGCAYSWRRTWASLGILDIRACALCELFKEKGTLKAELLNGSIEARKALACGIVGFLDLIHSLLELNAFLAIGCFDGGREFWRDGTWRLC